ncbi:MAG: PhnD/SsuA/transferrin family substrate-binding protein [Gammaproteobacteria bacterium]
MISRRIFKSFVTAVLVGATLLPSIVLAQGLILTAPPREKAEDGQKVYGPLAAHLTELLGVPVTYKHPRSWLHYQNEMRHDAYDIVFDGPHFISWRQEHLKHEVVAKLPGTLEFFLVARADDSSVNTLDDLIGQKICGISPPNLSTLTVLDKFRNPVRQPVIKGVKGGMVGVAKAFDAGQCKAAVFRDTYYKKKLTETDRAALKVLLHSKPIPNQGISVSRRLSPAARVRMMESLTIGEGVQATAEITRRFGGKGVKAFVPASRAEYEGYNNLLEGVIFGW